MEGTIVKGIAGFYYVKAGDSIYQCKARGLFRKQGMAPQVGDLVSIEVIDDEKMEGLINLIEPRKNQFIRPPIVNVDCFVIVMAVKKPEPNLGLLDKFIIMAEKNFTDIIVCINKIDLDVNDEYLSFKAIYEDLYPTVCVSCITGKGLDLLAQLMKNKKSALAGPSGVGKSTLLNRLQGKQLAETGEIGVKSQRGKHTTRHVELYELAGGGYIFDTPGFTSFEVLDAEEEELAFLYPEMVPFIGKCRYDNCRHISEPDCEIRKAVKDGKIHYSRYESYINQMKEIKDKRRY